MIEDMNTDTPISLSIVIPVYNSENTITRLVEGLIDSLSPRYRLEVILVNDNSKDGSEGSCISLHEKYKNTVKFYSLSKNVGEHSAVMAGLNKTTSDYVVIMDDDFQNPISEVFALVDKALANDFDVVYSYYRTKQHSTLRNAGSWFNDRVANIMLQKPKDLYLSSFKILNRFLVNEIIKYQSPFPYIDGLILQATDNIGKIEVEHHERLENRSGYTMKKLISLWLNMFTSFSILPLRFSTVLGFIFSFFGIILGIYTVFEKLSNPHLPVGFASLIFAVSVFAGVQLISLGIIGEYVGRVFLSLNKKPQYTIKKSFE
ncbi:MAG: glycosyltransferase family 2 protein [Thermodesulfovibrionales bacterium]